MKIAQIMVSVFEAEGISLCEQQRLFTGHRVTSDVTQTLAELGIQEGSTVDVASCDWAVLVNRFSAGRLVSGHDHG